ncbi:hypothetical protein C8F01DRAFT_1235376 [Mycena amicta]|nr:hypothetical protein C8F01DRAFT_1235376 [Mycena amicta]
MGGPGGGCMSGHIVQGWRDGEGGGHKSVCRNSHWETSWAVGEDFNGRRQPAVAWSQWPKTAKGTSRMLMLMGMMLGSTIAQALESHAKDCFETTRSMLTWFSGSNAIPSVFQTAEDFRQHSNDADAVKHCLYAFHLSDDIPVSHMVLLGGLLLRSQLEGQIALCFQLASGLPTPYIQNTLHVLLCDPPSSRTTPTSSKVSGWPVTSSRRTERKHRGLHGPADALVEGHGGLRRGRVALEDVVEATLVELALLSPVCGGMHIGRNVRRRKVRYLSQFSDWMTMKQSTISCPPWWERATGIAWDIIRVKQRSLADRRPIATFLDHPLVVSKWKTGKSS